MKKMVEIVKELGLRLDNFGQGSHSKEIIIKTIEANEWFTSTDICGSVEAIRSTMLDCDKLQEWAAHYPTLPATTPRKIAIIMAGNIPLVGFFDLLCTLMAGHEAWVKPSSKDKVLMDYVSRLLREIEPEIPIYIYDDSATYDAVIATGGDEANRYFDKRFGSTKRLCRASRHSVAVLSGTESAEQLQHLAEDIYSYSGLGCRSVAMIFSPKGHLVDIPTYQTNPKYRNNYLQTRALATITGKQFVDNGCSVIAPSKEFPHTLSTISLFEYDSLSEVEQWLTEHDDTLQCIVSNCIDHPRRVDFGEAQHPTLFDYADGVDTMQFLMLD